MFPGYGVARERSGAGWALVPPIWPSFLRSIASATSKTKQAWNVPAAIGGLLDIMMQARLPEHRGRTWWQGAVDGPEVRG
jgi:hypothetical protein